MANVRIEMDRGMGWETRNEGECSLEPIAGTEGLPAYIAGYATRWPHRAFVDGVLVAEALPPKRRRRVGAC